MRVISAAELRNVCGLWVAVKKALCLWRLKTMGLIRAMPGILWRKKREREKRSPTKMSLSLSHITISS